MRPVRLPVPARNANGAARGGAAPGVPMHRGRWLWMRLPGAVGPRGKAPPPPRPGATAHAVPAAACRQPFRRARRPCDPDRRRRPRRRTLAAPSSRAALDAGVAARVVRAPRRPRRGRRQRGCGRRPRAGTGAGREDVRDRPQRSPRRRQPVRLVPRSGRACGAAWRAVPAAPRTAAAAAPAAIPRAGPRSPRRRAHASTAPPPATRHRIPARRVQARAGTRARSRQTPVCTSTGCGHALLPGGPVGKRECGDFRAPTPEDSRTGGGVHPAPTRVSSLRRGAPGGRRRASPRARSP